MEHPEHEIEATDSLGLTDVILPSQFFGPMGSGGLRSEQRLMLAVLVDAINILQRWNRMGSARKRRTFTDAAQWILMKGTNYPFSFDNVCDALNIDSEMLRRRLGVPARGHGATNRLGARRLRLRESIRANQMTANRVRRRDRRAAVRFPIDQESA
jgi:hypothetical protein